MPVADKKGMAGSLAGGIGGGFLWVVILGVVIRSPLAAVSAIVCGVVCYVVCMKLYGAHPERSFAILGAALLWVVLCDLAFVNLLYERIPETVGAFTTGKAQFSLASLNVFLVGFSLVGFRLLIKDIRGKHRAR